METPKDFLEGYDPQIKEVGHESYVYTTKQVINRLEAYRKEIVKESDSLPSVSDQRELLIAFAEHMDTDDPNEFQGHSYSEIVDNFLKSNL
jgi:hypothetical protein